MDQRQQIYVAKPLTKYASVFSETDVDIGRTGVVRHRINTGNAHPIKQPLRRTHIHVNAEVDQQIDDMLQQNVIKPSSSSWSSGIVLVLAAVKCRPVIHHCVVIFSSSSGIMECT